MQVSRKNSENMRMIDYTELRTGDDWEAFCRDYLVAIGFVVDRPPGRGPDGGQDLLVREQLRGKLATQNFVWLVSCKHYAGSGKSVGTGDEQNIVDRITHHDANGFIGFYSTVASSSLIDRLKEYRDQETISSFEIFDGTRIENSFHDVGLSGVLLQHLPNAHTNLRPIHPLLDQYTPLNCEVCGKDLLQDSLLGQFRGEIVFGARENGETVSVHVCCKHPCDDQICRVLHARGLADLWDDIEDYCNPLIFLRHITGYINQMRNEPASFSDEAHARMIEIYLAVSQRTLRQTSLEDREHYFRARKNEEFGL